MAKQDSNPPPWEDSMSDGCTGVLDWIPLVGNMTAACLAHDRAYHYGGTKADKARADKQLKKDITALGGWFAWFCARIRYFAVRKLADNAFNWKGPGLPKKMLSGES